MTVSRLTKEVTREEMTGWAAYFALQNEEREREKDAVQNRAARRVQAR